MASQFVPVAILGSQQQTDWKSKCNNSLSKWGFAVCSSLSFSSSSSLSIPLMWCHHTTPLPASVVSNQNSLCSVVCCVNLRLDDDAAAAGTPWKIIPQQYVDLGKAFPLLPALGTLVLVRGFPPQSQTVAAEVVAAGQSGGVHQDVVATVAREFEFWDVAGVRALWLGQIRFVEGVVHRCSQSVVGWIPLHLLQHIQKEENKVAKQGSYTFSTSKCHTYFSRLKFPSSR